MSSNEMDNRAKSFLVYIAGPLYTSSQRQYLEQIDTICQRMGLSTYLPHRDAGLAKSCDVKGIFEKDLNALKSSDLVIAVLDGPIADDGTSWEMGYAYALGIPIIGIVEDFRVRDPQLDINLMIASTCKIVTSLQKLEEELQTFIRHKNLQYP